MVILPLLLYPLIFIVASQLTKSQMQKIEADVAAVAVVGAETPDALKLAIAADEHLELVEGPGSAEHARQLVAAGTVQVALILPEGFHEKLEGEEALEVELLYDQTHETSTRAELDSALSETAKAARSLRVLANYLEQHPEALIKGKG